MSLDTSTESIVSGGSSPTLLGAYLGSSVGQMIPMESVLGVSDGSVTPPTRRFSTLSNFYSISRICRDQVPGWKAAVRSDEEKIEIKQLMEGLSNQLYKVTLTNVATNAVAYKTVLFRIYGEHVSSFYNPEHELAVFKTISHLQIGPRMIANGPTWRIEEYYESFVLPVSSLGNPSIFCQVASQLGRLHKLSLPSSFDRRPMASIRLESWTQAGLLALEKLNLSDSARDSLRIDEILEEVDRMKSLIEASQGLEGWDVVFCHNDVQENNILVTPYGLRLIDFEYADFNYQLADLGNFFNEFTMDYLHDGPGGFEAKPENYPSESVRRMFLSVYLSEYLGEPYLEDGGAKSDKISKYLRAAEIGSLLSHLLWGMWSLVRAQQQVDTFGSFDFVSYAKFRFDSYTSKKHIISSI